MRTTLIIITFSAGLCCCISHAAKPGGEAQGIASKMTDTVNYNTEVLPVLQKKCSPCHFAGGKMYEKMPFDNSLTILSHEAGVLKRIKDQPEASLVKQFIQQRSREN
jgi:hypothetical protein